jgi:excisionase family DNA binding protein
MAENKEERMAVATGPQPLYRLAEVAEILGVSRERVRELVASGELPSVRLGGSGWHRFRPIDVEQLINPERQAS